MRDKREHKRTPLDCRIRCELPGERAFEAQARDISLGGMFVFHDQPLPFGAELTIVIELPHAKSPLRLPAVVRWSNAEGFGVQFGLLGAVATHAITKLFSTGAYPTLNDA